MITGRYRLRACRASVSPPPPRRQHLRVLSGRGNLPNACASRAALKDAFGAATAAGGCERVIASRHDRLLCLRHPDGSNCSPSGPPASFQLTDHRLCAKPAEESGFSREIGSQVRQQNSLDTWSRHYCLARYRPECLCHSVRCCRSRCLPPNGGGPTSVRRERSLRHSWEGRNAGSATSIIRSCARCGRTPLGTKVWMPAFPGMTRGTG